MGAISSPLAISLAEALLLLATDDATGEVSTNSGALNFGLAGATIAELVEEGRLMIAGGHLMTTGESTTGDIVLDDALARIGESKKPRDAKYWVRKLANNKLKDQILDRLVGQGMLRREEHRILWVFPTNRYPAIDTSAEATIRDEVRAAVFGYESGATIKPHTAAIIGLLHGCKLDDTVFDRQERKQYKRQIEEISKSEAMGETVAKVVRDAEAATAAAITAATLSASSAGTR
jgi:hypothetical protein